MRTVPHHCTSLLLTLAAGLQAETPLGGAAATRLQLYCIITCEKPVEFIVSDALGSQHLDSHASLFNDPFPTGSWARRNEMRVELVHWISLFIFGYRRDSRKDPESDGVSAQRQFAEKVAEILRNLLGSAQNFVPSKAASGRI